MRYILYAMVFLCLSNCSNTQYSKDIPFPDVTKEQDTPFVFKERYQTQDLPLTSMTVIHANDFVNIESSTEYVFWENTSSTVFSVHEGKAKDELPLSANTPSDTPIAKPAMPFLAPDSVKADSQLPPTGASRCVPIFCNSNRCGSIKVCGEQPCEITKSQTYHCDKEKCHLKTDTPMSSSKGEIECSQYPELDLCPNQTACTVKL